MTDPTLVEELERKQAERAATERESKQQIPQYKPKNDWSADDFFQYTKTGRKPLNPEYVERRNQALEKAGLETDDLGGKEPEQMSVEDHIDHIRRHRD